MSKKNDFSIKPNKVGNLIKKFEKNAYLAQSNGSREDIDEVEAYVDLYIAAKNAKNAATVTEANKLVKKAVNSYKNSDDEFWATVNTNDDNDSDDDIDKIEAYIDGLAAKLTDPESKTNSTASNTATVTETNKLVKKDENKDNNDPWSFIDEDSQDDNNSDDSSDVDVAGNINTDNH